MQSSIVTNECRRSSKKISKYPIIGCRILSSIQVVISPVIHWSVLLSSMRRVVKGGWGDILARYMITLLENIKI